MRVIHWVSTSRRSARCTAEERGYSSHGWLTYKQAEALGGNVVEVIERAFGLQGSDDEEVGWSASSVRGRSRDGIPPRIVLAGHNTQPSILECLHIRNAVACCGQYSFRKGLTGAVAYHRVAVKMRSDLLPSHLECFAHGFDRGWAKRSPVNQSTRFHGKVPATH
jgi:hypothetical protein